jgi:hypothetical protein
VPEDQNLMTAWVASVMETMGEDFWDVAEKQRVQALNGEFDVDQ